MNIAGDIYRRLPLDPGLQQIRLLRLTSDDGELRGRLEVVSLADKPRYTAVSYAWIEDTPSSYIKCKRCEFARDYITEVSLDLILRYWQEKLLDRSSMHQSEG